MVKKTNFDLVLLFLALVLRFDGYLSSDDERKLKGNESFSTFVSLTAFILFNITVVLYQS